MTDKTTSSNRLLIALAWAIILCVSVLPNVLLHELTGGAPAWLTWAKIGLLIALAVAALFWQALPPTARLYSAFSGDFRG